MFDARAVQIGIGADYDAYRRDGLRLTMSPGIRYIDADSDDISESGGIAALEIEGMRAKSLLADVIVKLAYIPGSTRYGLSIYAGYQHDFQDAQREIDAGLVVGGNHYRIISPGLGDTGFIYGASSYYDISQDLRISAGLRGEARSDANDAQALDIRLTYRF